jgi:2',3'-cyclic-nucleotide 2'-phosphodiesterase (5'-nucleotidase family)
LRRPAAAQSGRITLLHISDPTPTLPPGTQGENLDGTLGGSPAPAIVAAENFDPNALFVHAGDIMDGDFFFNEASGCPSSVEVDQARRVHPGQPRTGSAGFWPAFFRPA